MQLNDYKQAQQRVALAQLREDGARPSDDPGDAPRRPRPRIAEEAEQTFVRVPRPLHGPDALRIQQEGVLRQLTQALEHSD